MKVEGRQKTMCVNHGSLTMTWEQCFVSKGEFSPDCQMLKYNGDSLLSFTPSTRSRNACTSSHSFTSLEAHFEFVQDDLLPLRRVKLLYETLPVHLTNTRFFGALYIFHLFLSSQRTKDHPPTPFFRCISREGSY